MIQTTNIYVYCIDLYFVIEDAKAKDFIEQHRDMTKGEAEELGRYPMMLIFVIFTNLVNEQP